MWNLTEKWKLEKILDIDRLIFYDLHAVTFKKIQMEDIDHGYYRSARTLSRPFHLAGPIQPTF
jgi:hypothetical protein